MKTTGLLLLILLLAAGCATPRPRLDSGLAPLDQLVPVARWEASRRFKQTEERLWFWNLKCQYSQGHYEQDATNSLHTYTLVFFDPESVRPTANDRSVDAMGYHITLTPDGEFVRSSHGRGIGWTQ